MMAMVFVEVLIEGEVGKIVALMVVAVDLEVVIIIYL